MLVFDIDGDPRRTTGSFEGYTIHVQPITCGDRQCTTWVSSPPLVGEDCFPSCDVEMIRPMMGGFWTIGESAHGDPPRTFEP